LCDRAIIINKGEVVIDDRVENLLKLFETRAYSIKLGEKLSLEQENKLLSRFPLSTYKTSSHETIVEVNLEHGQDIYELFDLLKEEGTMVESIDRITIDFEQVFIQIVKGGMTSEVAPLIQC
jgi:ABC-2 type transport system ATP-binding protein